MEYESIEAKPLSEISPILFGVTDIADKRMALLSAIYNLPIEQVISTLVRIFDSEDTPLKLEAFRYLDAFMQSRSTRQGYSKFCDYITSFSSANLAYKDELDEIFETLKELNSILGNTQCS